MLSLRVFLTIKNKLSIQLHCTFVPRHNDVLLLKVFDHESQKGVRNQQIILCVWVSCVVCVVTLVPRHDSGFVVRKLGPDVVHTVACNVWSYQLFNYVQQALIRPNVLHCLIKKNHLFVRRKLRKCTKKTHKIPFIVICKFPKRFNRFHTTFELRSMIFFPFFLPTVFCHSFTLSFYSFKYESASTFSFFRQKL